MKWRLATLLALGLVSCARLKKRPEAESAVPPPVATPKPAVRSGVIPITFSSMGTVWTIHIAKRGSINEALLQQSLMEEALEVDRTFSDWMQDSELRKMERAGLTEQQLPSPLFMRGLLLARDVYKMTDRTFDITVGAVIWKKRENPVGMDKLVIQGKAFRFTEDPKRLTFGGLIKGSATGLMAARLREAGIKNFVIDAGGGNLAALGRSSEGPWLPEQDNFESNSLVFVSNSNSYQKNDMQHVINPLEPTQKIDRSIQVVCKASDQTRKWFREGGIADALSTALLVKPDLKNIPDNCLANMRQSGR